MTHRVDELDAWVFDECAIDAKRGLDRERHAFIDLQPGDATTYKIVVVEYAGQHWVGTSFGRLHPWNPEMNLHWDYVADKWVEDGREWTARVICRFLNTLSDKMKETSDG